MYFLVCFADVIPRTDFLNDGVVAESFASTAQRLTSQSSGKGDPPVVFLPPIFALLTRESMSVRVRAQFEMIPCRDGEAEAAGFPAGFVRLLRRHRPSVVDMQEAVPL